MFAERAAAHIETHWCDEIEDDGGAHPLVRATPNAAGAPRPGRAPGSSCPIVTVSSPISPSSLWPRGRSPSGSVPPAPTDLFQRRGWMERLQALGEVLGSSSSRLVLVVLQCVCQTPAVVGCVRRETVACKGFTCGIVRRQNGCAYTLNIAIGHVGFAGEHWTNGATGEGRRQSRRMRHPFWEGNRGENDPSQIQHPSTKRSV